MSFIVKYDRRNRDRDYHKLHPSKIENWHLETGSIDAKQLNKTDLQLLWDKWGAPMKIKVTRLDAAKRLDLEETKHQKEQAAIDSHAGAQNELHDAVSGELDRLLK